MKLLFSPRPLLLDFVVVHRTPTHSHNLTRKTSFVPPSLSSSKKSLDQKKTNDDERRTERGITEIKKITISAFEEKMMLT